MNLFFHLKFSMNFNAKFRFYRRDKSKLIVAYREYTVVTYERSSLYTINEFLAVCGGLLGLFLGLSVLNIIQFVYNSVLRLFFVILQSKSNRNVTPIHPNITLKNNTMQTINEMNWNLHVTKCWGKLTYCNNNLNIFSSCIMYSMCLMCSLCLIFVNILRQNFPFVLELVEEVTP